MARRRTLRTPRMGWAALADLHANPVPGDIPACLDEMGLTIIRILDDEVHMKCPAHFKRLGKEDRHPSFSVNATEGIFNCFSCGFTGRFHELVKEVLDLSLEDALAWCRDRGGVERAKRLVREEGGLKFVENDTTKQINEASLALFVSVPQHMAEDRRLTVDACDEVGVLWDAPRECWIVPIRNPETGRLMGWQEKNERYFKNVPYGVEKGLSLFGLQAIDPSETTVIVVESPLDVVRLRAAGYENAVATYGSKITNEQFDILFERFDVIIWALDNDESGEKALKVIKALHRGRPNIQRVIKYPNSPFRKDPGDMHDDEIYRAIEGATSLVLHGLAV